jgi:hypothetical protein
MKKLLLVALYASFVTACNNSGDSSYSKDSTTVDTIRRDTSTIVIDNDTSAHNGMDNKIKIDTAKKK